MLRADCTAIPLASIRFAALVRDGRALLALSQADLAERSGVSRQAIARLEAGHGGMAARDLEALLSTLDAGGVALAATGRPDLRDAPRWVSR